MFGMTEYEIKELLEEELDLVAPVGDNTPDHRELLRKANRLIAKAIAANNVIIEEHHKRH